MKKYFKRKIAIMMSLILLISGIDVNVSMSSASVKSPNSSKITTDNLSVKSTNSVGELIEEAVAEKENEKETNNGNNIFSVEMREKTQEELEDGEEDQEKIFVVNLETVETCKLLLAIYTEDGKEMITSSTSSVCQDDTNVEFWLEKIPEYFIIRAFLIDSETNQPLCIKYESPMYTKEMQDFMAKETKDFDKDKVLNLDDSENNNFAVYDKDTKVIDETGTKNVLREVDENEQRYVFDNIDSKISSLKEGEILSYEKEDNNVLIVKVHEIEIDGDTAVIIGEDTSMDEVFDYVKIDGEQDLGDAQIEESKEDGIQYEGLKKEKDVSTRALDYVGKESLEASVKFIDKKVGGEHAKAKVNGSVKLSMTTSVKVYVSMNYQYLEMKIDFKLSNELSLSGTVKGSIPLLATVGFSPVPGVIIEFTPSISLEGSASVSIKATVKATVGFSVSPQDGFKNLTSSPKYDDTKIEGKVNVFLGLSLEPKVVVISKSVAEASAKATAGGVINGTLELYSSSPSESVKHDCKSCIEGDISAKIVLSVDVTFVSALKIEHSKEYQFKITDFYYSLDSQTWGWSTCPNKKYKIMVIAKNPNGNPVEGAIINNSYKTDQNGIAVIWLNDGSYTFSAAKGSIESVKKNIVVLGKSKKIVIIFGTNTGIQGNEDSTSNPLIGKKVKSVSVNRYNCGIITTEGDLYTWGYDDGNGQLGSGLFQHKVPQKILSNVEKVQMLDCGPGAALTVNGELYIWGNGNWAGSDSCNWHYGEKPIKILENVRSFKMDGFGSLVCYALTNDDELYLWGTYDMSDILEDYDEKKPCKVMDDVKDADIMQVGSTGWYEHNVCCAIKNNGDLYIWGGNHGGILGDLGMDEDEEEMLGSVTPIKRLENVKEAKLGEGYCVALTNTNDLYAWGENSLGCVGDGTKDDVYEPRKVMSDIISYDVSGDSVAAVNNKNQLFVWGENLHEKWDSEKDEDYESALLVPTLLLNNIREVRLSEYAGSAKTISGGWYMWGESAYVGETGTYKPYKCPLKNVEMLNFCSSRQTIYAITKKNDLYFWGDNGFWNYEFEWDWSSESKYDPVKINGDLSSFKMTAPDDNYDTYSLKKSNPTKFKLSDEIATLDPDSVYNIYVVEDDEKDWLADDNLLYVDQCMSDNEGKFDLEYETRRELDGEPYVMFCKLNRINITECSIKVEDLFSTDSSTLVEINVSYNGKKLVEGVDYELSGDVEVKKTGIYSLNIEGIGIYTGTVEKSFHVYCDHLYGEWTVMQSPTSTEEGLKKQTCIKCGEEKTETIPKLSSSKEKPSNNNKVNISTPKTSSVNKSVKKPSKVTGLKVINKKKRKLVVSWNWKLSVSGFQIQYAQNKKFTKKKKSKMVGKWTSEKTITKLKKGKTYYVRVRAYKKSAGKKIYGKWSKIKKIKIRK